MTKKTEHKPAESSSKTPQNDVQNLVRIHIMGRDYSVPNDLAIMKALEYAGFKYIRGAGCRGGYCGACATLYRLKGDYNLYPALACEHMVEDGMYLAQLPFVPAEKVLYKLDDLKADGTLLLQYYPEIARCVSCNTCTKACPQDLKVMDYVQAGLRGDIEKVAELSFDCIMCGLCAMRCPAGIVPYNMAQLARRLYGKFIAPPSKELVMRVAEVIEGKYEDDIQNMMKMSKKDLRKLYDSRDIEVEE
ncbi:MAG: 4Fe-4S dicluster domain-containing protein [Candidatus Ranarchaeia archaeon]|jgi:heterodisulfide reductase subunit C